MIWMFGFSVKGVDGGLNVYFFFKGWDFGFYGSVVLVNVWLVVFVKGYCVGL